VSDFEEYLFVTTISPPAPASAEDFNAGFLPRETRCIGAGAPELAVRDPSVEARIAGTLAGSAMAEFSRRIENELAFLRKRVRRWHRDRANAEDLVQDTVLQALANAHLWQPGSNLRGWLLTIMRNQFLAAAAKSKRSSELLAAFAARDGHLPSHPSGPRLLLRDVERALVRLSAIQRTVIVAVGIDGKSYSEVAQMLGMSVGAVRCHLARARERLRAAVNDARYAVPFATGPAPRAIGPALPILPVPAHSAIPLPAMVGAD
jgi:RNA polymerase sigma-70 factor (ECF subfamily)